MLLPLLLSLDSVINSSHLLTAPRRNPRMPVNCHLFRLSKDSQAKPNPHRYYNFLSAQRYRVHPTNLRANQTTQMHLSQSLASTNLHPLSHLAIATRLFLLLLLIIMAVGVSRLHQVDLFGVSNRELLM
eukprot:PhF_6_TR42923/c0_g1_i4/m.65085